MNVIVLVVGVVVGVAVVVLVVVPVLVVVVEAEVAVVSVATMAPHTTLVRGTQDFGTHSFSFSWRISSNSPNNLMGVFFL